MELSHRDRLILAIDHHPDHLDTIRTSLNQGQISCNVVAIAQPQTALDYLRHQGPYTQAPRPDLILLDLDGCTSDHSDDLETGLDLLQTIKADPRLKRIPIIILTLLEDHTLIRRSYEIQGNCYVLKSSNLSQLAQIMQRIEEFWLGIVTLPLE